MKKRRRGSGWLLNLGIALCGICVVYFAAQILHTWLEYRRGGETYGALSELAVTGQEQDLPVCTTTPAQEEPASPPRMEEQLRPDDFLRPLEARGSGISVNFDVLRGINSEIVGWLYSPDTVIDYPIVQGNDNQYYLNRMFDGTRNSAGTLFLDYRGLADWSGENNVVYGHHMKNGSMLASIEKYAEQEYYDAHPVMYLIVPEGEYRVELFAGYTAPADSDAYAMAFSGAEDYQAWLAARLEKSDFDAGISLTPEDKVITLSTCAYVYQDARYVLHGRLTPVEN